IGYFAAEAEPEDIDGDAKFDYPHVRGLAGDGVASIAADDQIGGALCRAGRGLDCGSGDAAIAGKQPGGFVFHTEIESGELAASLGEEVEQIPLRHERDEFALRWQVAKISDGKGVAPESPDDEGHLLVRNFQEVV